MYEDINKVDLAYVAGLIDGEGSICLQRSHSYMKYRRPAVTVSNTSKELLDFLKELFGGYVCTHKTYKKTHKKSWAWHLVDRRAVEFCRVLLPFLREKEKIRRARLIAEKYDKVTVRCGKYTEEMKDKKLQFEKAFAG